MTLHVAMVVRPDLWSNPGGDTTQIDETARELRRLGVDVSIVLSKGREIPPEISGADIIHCFNVLLSFQFRHIIESAHAAGKRVVLSPVYWDMEGYESGGSGVPAWKKIAASVLSRLAAGRPLKSFMTSHLKTVTYNRCYRDSLNEILGVVDHLLPNSESEYFSLRRRFDVNAPWSVVVNGCRVPEHESAHLSQTEPFVLCVGRIERRKNQLSLIRAMKGIPHRLVLIGNINMAEAEYWKECQAAARRSNVRVRHIPGIDWHELWPYYQSAAVHIQPSWFETPGLSSLEAAAAGCPIVCTRVGSAPEYFGSRAVYCDPEDESSIREALLAALESCADRASAAAFVRKHFSWQNAAAQTLNVYLKLLERSAVESLHA